MEKSRAIELLEHLAWDRDIERNPYGDALNMAIEALKAQLSKEGTTYDLISRMETVEHLRRVLDATVPITDYDEGYVDGVQFAINTVSTMSAIQPEPAIPVAWIEGKIKRLNNMDNYFAELTANIIKTMLNEWRKGEPMGRLLDEDMIIKVLERWQKAFKENSHYVSASDLSLVVKDVKELPPAQPESNCLGCKHVGMWEDEVEYGYPSPCTRCKRRANDNYEQ